MDSSTQGVTDEGIYLYIFQSTPVSHLQILLRTTFFKDSSLSVSGNREYNRNCCEALSLVLPFSKTNTERNSYAIIDSSPPLGNTFR